MRGWVGEWDVCDWGRGMCMFGGQTSIAGGVGGMHDWKHARPYTFGKQAVRILLECWHAILSREKKVFHI